METTNRDTAQNAVPQDKWQDAEPNASITQNNESDSIEATIYTNDDETEERLYATGSTDDPEDEDEDDEDEDEDDEAGDWGHVDPAEGNSPFPDSNDPSGPGSAV